MKSILFALSLILLLPSSSYATITAAVSCQARLSLRDGTRLSYILEGGLEFADNGRIVESSLRTPNLFITIIRQERTGRGKFLRTREQLGNWSYDAPDSTLSIPFSRSLSLATTEVFHVPSADYGIYIGMKTSKPTQIQVVHYLDRNRFVKSDLSTCSLRSE